MSQSATLRLVATLPDGKETEHAVSALWPDGEPVPLTQMMKPLFEKLALDFGPWLEDSK